MRPSWPPPTRPIVALGGSGDVIRGRVGHSLRSAPRAALSSRSANAGSLFARIAAASRAALTAPARPIASVPTGMPAGICTIDKQAVHALKTVGFDRHAEHRQRRPGGAHAGQMRGAAGAGDDHLQTAFAGLPWHNRATGPACDAPRRSASRAALPDVQRLRRMAHGGPVRLAAHDDADDRTHQAILSGISRLSSQAISSFSIACASSAAADATDLPRPVPPGARSRCRGRDARCGVRAACAAASPGRSASRFNTTKPQSAPSPRRADSSWP